MTEAQTFTLVYRANSIMERDALVASLVGAGIQSEIDQRDIPRRMINSSVDLSYEGYSAVAFDGYPILVAESDMKRAESLIRSELERFKKQDESDPMNEGERHLQKFVESGLFSFFLPGLFHITALYHLKKAVELKAPIRSAKFIFASLLLLLSAVLVPFAFEAFGGGTVWEYLTGIFRPYLQW